MAVRVLMQDPCPFGLPEILILAHIGFYTEVIDPGSDCVHPYPLGLPNLRRR